MMKARKEVIALNEPLNIQGMDSLLRYIEQLGEQAEEIKTTALEQGAEVFRIEIQDNAPRGEGNDHMADHIITKISDDQAKIGPSSDYYYAHFLEFGTKKMSARPFMGPTFERKKEEAQQKMAEIIRDELGL
jgi:HK97 gp10 family phage protein